ncbi:PREDICTED: protein S100-A9-like [Apaloderma vittatum]|uniref:protein S100-A9-like n=1 Tax=Apaloderma vittatum TaxID=57397 RepID=UPI000521ABEA|nr:PREDICTED: protein S100-A9-like [Apaloderma vittatum]
MKTDLELALECIINIYHQYAVKRPIDDYLSKEEFSELLKKDAQPFLHNTMPPNTTVDDYIGKLYAKADSNHDGRLKFTEFLTTLNLVFIDAHNRSHGRGHGHGHGHEHEHGHRHDHSHDHGHGPRN